MIEYTECDRNTLSRVLITFNVDAWQVAHILSRRSVHLSAHPDNGGPASVLVAAWAPWAAAAGVRARVRLDIDALRAMLPADTTALNVAHHVIAQLEEPTPDARALAPQPQGYGADDAAWLASLGRE